MNAITNPDSTAGAKNPPLQGRECRGTDLSIMSTDDLYAQPGLHLEWILFAYNNYPQKSAFFTSYFDTLAGTRTLREQISAGLSEEEIKASWKPGIEKFIGEKRYNETLYSLINRITQTTYSLNQHTK